MGNLIWSLLWVKLGTFCFLLVVASSRVRTCFIEWIVLHWQKGPGSKRKVHRPHHFSKGHVKSSGEVHTWDSIRILSYRYIYIYSIYLSYINPILVVSKPIKPPEKNWLNGWCYDHDSYPYPSSMWPINPSTSREKIPPVVVDRCLTPHENYGGGFNPFEKY